MTVVVSWNIQNGKGTDDLVSLPRIAGVIANMGDPDIICLQEVSRHLPLFGAARAVDQTAELTSLFPGYEVLFGIAIEADRNGKTPRWQYGNATLTRLPVLSVFTHPLPQPADGTVRHMPRQATETTIATAGGPLRVVNTHLEFHSKRQRLAQIARLRDLHRETAANTQAPANHDADGSYQHLNRPQSCIICGDFNIDVGSQEYDAMLSSVAGDTAPLHDAWRGVHRDQPHKPTCGVHDHVQWPQGPHCRDFFFVTGDVSAAIESLTVDTETNASDHQPLMLSIADQS